MSTMSLAISGTSIRQDSNGRFCLNDLHKAAGGENKHRPSLWVENQQTKSLISELESEAGIPALVSLKGGKVSGTFAAKELVYAYAMWISAKFHIAVIRAYDSIVSQKQIAESDMTAIVWNGVPVLTSAMLATLYGSYTNMISQNFTQNPDKFNNGEHYFKLTGNELRQFKAENDNIAYGASHLCLWTESGAIAHAEILEIGNSRVFRDECGNFKFTKNKHVDYGLKAIAPTYASTEMRRHVTEMVNKRAYLESKSYQSIWDELKGEFKFQLVSEIPIIQYPQICEYFNETPAFDMPQLIQVDSRYLTALEAKVKELPTAVPKLRLVSGEELIAVPLSMFDEMNEKILLLEKISNVLKA